METEFFSDGEKLLEFLDQGQSLDLLFLDIELHGMNGVEIGKKLKREIQNQVIQLVYVSSKENYAIQLFQIRPFDFLTKPVCQESVSNVLTEYKQQFIDKNIFFTYHIGKSEYHLSENAILYFLCRGKKVLAVTTKGEKEFYGKMSDVEKQVSPDKFCTVHKSYIVNINYVVEFRPEEVVMSTGLRIPISQSCRKKVRQRLLEWNIQTRR